MTDFPIILREGEVHGEVYGITGAFVGYVNDLIRGGVQTKDLPGAFLDLYALDFYYWQVCNGGHSQFVGNAGARLQADLDHAIRGAALIGMPDLAQLMEDCRDWCDANLDERDRQDGSANRASALDALDDRFFSQELMDHEEAGFAAFVASQPTLVRAWLEEATRHSRFRSRNRYCLASGAWLRAYPGIRILPRDEVSAAVAAIVTAH